MQAWPQRSSPRWRIFRRHPGVPDRVHLSEIRHVGNPDIGGKELSLVGPGRGQEAIDLRQNAFGLLGGTFAFRIIGNDALEIDGIAVDHRLAHARSGFVTFDLHR
jgi:hypothetical protein